MCIRGVLNSYEIESILDRVESCISEGVKEIWLTSEDLGAYGIDLGTNIITLLHSIIAVLPKDIMLRCELLVYQLLSTHLPIIHV